jgi:hypothetical protein
MPKEAAIAEHHPVYPSADSSPDEGELPDPANLPTEQTGLEGVIHLCTAQSGDAPCVKWYPGRCAHDAPWLSVTIATPPQPSCHHLPKRAFDAAYPPLAAWVTLNAAALLDFWHHGSAWPDDQRTAFKQALAKLPPRG